MLWWDSQAPATALPSQPPGACSLSVAALGLLISSEQIRSTESPSAGLSLVMLLLGHACGRLLRTLIQNNAIGMLENILSGRKTLEIRSCRCQAKSYLAFAGHVHGRVSLGDSFEVKSDEEWVQLQWNVPTRPYSKKLKSKTMAHPILERVRCSPAVPFQYFHGQQGICRFRALHGPTPIPAFTQHMFWVVLTVSRDIVGPALASPAWKASTRFSAFTSGTNSNFAFAKAKILPGVSCSRRHTPRSSWFLGFHAMRKDLVFRWSHQRAWVQRLRDGTTLFRWILSDLHAYLQDKIFLSENVRGRRFCRALKSLCRDNIVTEADVVLPDLSLAGTARQLLRQLGRSDLRPGWTPSRASSPWSRWPSSASPDSPRS